MEIILLKDVRSGKRRLGNIGDIVKVANGYARYLFSKGVACFATPAARAEVEQRRAELEKQAADELRLAQVQGEKLATLTVQISQKAGMGGVLFGSVTKEMIAKYLKDQGFAIQKSQVSIPDGLLKRVGDHTVQVELHADVVVDVNVSVLGEAA